ncbi:MAG: carboxypeptidase regulatory-like domain-containing protein, partial [Planctomycetes bacterium]|nr:carboxypeptidase regulatory-like domain-containing protein [Planctomycetota bacterium]
IHSLDDGHVDPDKHYSLKIPTEDRGNYWVEYRNNYTTNAFKNGALLQAQGGGEWTGNNIKPVRIDVTYWSSKDKKDSPIPLGWTFSDHEQGLHITPVARDGDLTWIDLQVNKGSFPGNRAPVATLIADTTNVATGVKVNLSVAATDPDGDELAFHWYCDDNEWHGNRNKTSLSKSWSNVGVRVVICTVSDMKGGVSIKKIPITVGSPTTFTISGRAKDHLGNPVAGAPVDNDLGKSKSNYRSTITDDDGNYTMTRLPAGNYTIKCRKDYDVYNNNFSNPVAVGPDMTGINFTARVLKVSAVGTSLSEAGGSAEFLIERVGNNSTLLKLNFRVLGKAVQNTDYTISPDPNNGVYRLEKEWDSLRLTVTGIDDAVNEGPEDVIFTLAMTNNLSVIGPNTIARLTIDDDDTALPRVRLAAVDEFMPENGGSALARVTRYGSLALPLTVYFNTANTAEYGVDYTFASGVKELTIPAGASTADIEVIALDDALIEGKEDLKITFQNGDYIKDSDQKNAVINITDDDIPTVTIAAVDETSSEPGVNDGAVRFVRTGDTADELSIEYGVRGTALHGTDYAQLS